MDSDTSLLQLDQSASFQLLDNSESFVLIDNSEIASHYEAEDEWLQIETGSIISSMSSVIKPDGSIMSDYSVLDNMHAMALNEGGKLIKTRPDIYVEDQTMRKILEYISMFSDEVTACLKASRSAKALVSSQLVQEDWEISSLIDLDDISSDVLFLLLDTLEEFGMYKLCLIVCNRYNLANRLGRYIVSLASKYSHLSDIRYGDIKTMGLVPRAAIAYTAVHNILEMIHPEYLRLKEKDDKNLGVETYRGLVLLGYWKKAVYLMDYDNSLALTSSFGDYKSFKQVYLSRVGKKNVNNLEDFSWVNFSSPELIEHCKLALDSIVNNFNAFKPITLNRAFLVYTEAPFPEFPECFKYNQLLWSFFLKKINNETFASELKSLFGESLKSISSKSLSVLSLHDFYAFMTQIIFGSEDLALNEVLTELSFEDYERFLQLSLKLFQELVHKREPSSLDHMFSIFSCFGIRRIVPAEVTSVYPLFTHVLVHRSSQILTGISEMPIGSIIPDLEASYILMPILDVRCIVFALLFSKLNKILVVRAAKLLKASTDELYTQSNLFGEYSTVAFIKALQINKSHCLSSYNYCKLSSDIIVEYKNLQIKLQEIMQLGETDYYSEIYVKMMKNSEIKKIEKRLKEIDKIATKDNNLSGEGFILSIVKLAENKTVEVELTKSARLAIMNQMQIYMQNAQGTSSNVVMRFAWIVYQLSRVANRVQFCVEMIRRRIKKVLHDGKKFSIANPAFEVALGFVDIDIFFTNGNMEEVVVTVLNIFNTDWGSLELEVKIILLYKATVAWTTSQRDTIHLTDTSKALLKLTTENKKVFTSKIIHKIFSPKEILLWLLIAIKEVCINELPDFQKNILSNYIYEILFYIFKYCELDLSLPATLKLKENTIYLEIIQSQAPSLNYAQFSQIKSESEFLEFQTSQILPNTTEISISKADPIQTSKHLDSLWALEMKTIALNLKLSRLLKPFTKSLIKRKPIANETDSIIMRYAKPIDLPLITNLNSYYSTLMNFFYRVKLSKVLDFHHIISKFAYIGDILLSIINSKVSNPELLIEELIEDIDDFKSWCLALTPEFEGPRPAHKKKYKMRWPLKLKYAKRIPRR